MAVELESKEVEKFIAHYHRHNDQTAAARYARPGITDYEAIGFAARILRSNHGQRLLIQMKKQTAVFAPLSDYVKKLEEIRDSALENGKFSAAVQAHMVIGKLAGHFDKPEPTQGLLGDASALSNEELLQRIAKLTGASGSAATRIIELTPERIPDGDNDG